MSYTATGGYFERKAPTVVDVNSPHIATSWTCEDDCDGKKCRTDSLSDPENQPLKFEPLRKSRPNVGSPMNIPEPPDDALVAINEDAPTGIPEAIWRAAMDAANNVAWPYEDTSAPMIDDEYDLAKCVRAAVEHLIEHLNTTAPSITADQMQDGKRYRVTVEGTCEGMDPEVPFTDGYLVLASGSNLDNVDLDYATRIEEIGGES